MWLAADAGEIVTSQARHGAEPHLTKVLYWLKEILNVQGCQRRECEIAAMQLTPQLFII